MRLFSNLSPSRGDKGGEVNKQFQVVCLEFFQNFRYSLLDGFFKDS